MKGEKRCRIVERLRLLFGVLAILTSVALNVQAAEFTVLNTANSGAGSLRQAILDANNNVGADTITFNISGAGPHTITLASALPDLASEISIINDRAGDEPVMVTIAAGLTIRIFKVAPDNVVLIAGLTITKGVLTGSNRGGGIWNDHATLTVRNCTVFDNTGGDYAGGI